MLRGAALYYHMEDVFTSGRPGITQNDTWTVLLWTFQNLSIRIRYHVHWFAVWRQLLQAVLLELGSTVQFSSPLNINKPGSKNMDACEII